MNTATTTQKRENLETNNNARRVVAPPVDVYENKDEVLLVADIPGVRADDIAIRFDRGELTISAPRARSPEGDALAVEQRAADFRRTFTVPQGIQSDAIQAECSLGVLKVHLPKVTAQKPRQIAVKAL